MLKTARNLIVRRKANGGGLRLVVVTYSTAASGAPLSKMVTTRRRFSKFVSAKNPARPYMVPSPDAASTKSEGGSYIYEFINGAISIPSHWLGGLGQAAVSKYLDHHERYLSHLKDQVAISKSRIGSMLARQKQQKQAEQETTEAAKMKTSPSKAAKEEETVDSFRLFIEEFENKSSEQVTSQIRLQPSAPATNSSLQKKPEDKPSASGQPKSTGGKLVLPLNVKLNQTLNNVKVNVTTRLSMDDLAEKAKKLCESLEQASSLHFKSLIIEDLKKLVYDHPEIRHSIYHKEKNVVTNLLKLRNFSTERNDKRLAGNINECLAMLGYVDQTAVKNRGLNILSLDGGGAKGLNTIQILKGLQKYCGDRPLNEVFDYICGTSTGGIIGSLLSVYKITLEECERQYKSFTAEMFSRSLAAGVSNLIMSQSYYDTKIWETMLRERMGEMLLINSARDENTAKLSLVSARTTVNNIKIFLFRNYNLPSRAKSNYEGTCQHKVWEAVRASSAAPGYHEDFKLGGFLFQDGGLLANNPTAIALHEAKQLWPSQPINCVVSVGNGRYKPAGYSDAKCSSINAFQKVNRLVDGLASTENVHTMCLDLLAPQLYYRFNPYMSEEFGLDENRPEKWNIMRYDTEMYMRRNDDKFRMAASQLLKRKSPLQVVKNLVNHKLYEFQS